MWNTINNMHRRYMPKKTNTKNKGDSFEKLVFEKLKK